MITILIRLRSHDRVQMPRCEGFAGRGVLFEGDQFDFINLVSRTQRFETRSHIAGGQRNDHHGIQMLKERLFDVHIHHQEARLGQFIRNAASAVLRQCEIRCL